MRSLVLGLGNDLLADDAAGLLAARAVRAGGACGADVVESALSGLALLDLLAGYDRAVVIDAVRTGRCPPGTIHEWGPEDLDQVVAPSPHYAGLPEIIAIASEMRLPFPREIRILAVEVADPETIGGAVHEAVLRAIPEVAARARERLARWREDPAHA